MNLYKGKILLEKVTTYLRKSSVVFAPLNDDVQSRVAHLPNKTYTGVYGYFLETKAKNPVASFGWVSGEPTKNGEDVVFTWDNSVSVQHPENYSGRTSYLKKPLGGKLWMNKVIGLPQLAIDWNQELHDQYGIYDFTRNMFMYREVFNEAVLDQIDQLAPNLPEIPDTLGWFVIR